MNFANLYMNHYHIAFSNEIFIKNYIANNDTCSTVKDSVRYSIDSKIHKDLLILCFNKSEYERLRLIEYLQGINQRR